MKIFRTLIDFSRLKDWKQFQDLCADLLEAEGFKNVHSAGTGPDFGRDLWAEEELEFSAGLSETIKWIVQCKHYAGSGRAVGAGEIKEIQDYLELHKADGILIITDTSLSSAAVLKLEKFNDSKSNPYHAAFWDKRILTNKLLSHRDVFRKYFGQVLEVEKLDEAWIFTNPYKLLDAYGENDRIFFFGRGEETKILLEAIYRYNIVVLIGESGVGKTSLMNAGVIPHLRNEGFQIVSERCLDDPVMRIRRGIIRDLNALPKESLNNLSACRTFSEFLKETQKVLDLNDMKMLVVVDQFEELFTLSNEEVQDELSAALVEIGTKSMSKGRFVFLFSLREDYFADLRSWSRSAKIDSIFSWDAIVRIERLTKNCAVEAMQKPAELVKASLEKELLEVMAQDLQKISEGFIFPPYLQIVCSTIFEEVKKVASRKKLDISRETYEKLGEAEKIVSDYFAEKLWVGFDAQEKETARNVLKALTTSEGLRERLTLEQIANACNCSHKKVESILARFINRRLIRRYAGEEDEEPTYELIHDFLSRRFCEEMTEEEKRIKEIQEILKSSTKDWKIHGWLLDREKLEMFLPYINKLNLDDIDTLSLLVLSGTKLYGSDADRLFATLRSKPLMLQILTKAVLEKPETGGWRRDKYWRADAWLYELVKALGGPATDYVITKFKETTNSRAYKLIKCLRGVEDQKCVDTCLDVLRNDKRGSCQLMAVQVLLSTEKGTKALCDLGELAIKLMVESISRDYEFGRLNGKGFIAVSRISPELTKELLLGKMKKPYDWRCSEEATGHLMSMHEAGLIDLDDSFITASIKHILNGAYYTAYYRKNMLELLARIDTKEARSLIIRALDDSSPLVKRTAAILLEDLDVGNEAIVALERVIADSTPYVIGHAQIALQKIRQRNELPH